MKNTTDIKLDEAINNAEQFIKQLEKMDDKKLSKHLDIIRLQQQMAFEQNNHSAIELLYEYEKQIIKARVNKFDQLHLKNK